MSGYIGTQPVPQATQTRDSFTATANQTSFATSGYTPEFLDVFLNGVKLAAADYTATNGSDVVLASGAAVNDILEVVAYSTFEVLNPTFDGNVTFTGNASFGDNDKAIFGDGSDLQIYHDGVHSYVSDTGGGSLVLSTNGSTVSINTDGPENMAIFRKDSSVDLFYNNSKKFETTSTGIDVTGTVNADGLTIDTTDPFMSFKESGATKLFIGESSVVGGGGAGYYDFYAVTGLGQRFFTNAAERMRIDSSGNVLVGKTSENTSTDGIELNRQDVIVATRNNDSPLILNRRTSDGDIALFRKDNTNVGSIYNGGGNLGVNSSGGLLLIDDIITPTSSADGTHDIGRSTARYKDAYLSGGIYLGGIGAANKLDDYEEGTWTPSAGTGTISSNFARYTKVGNLVTIIGNIYSFSDRSSSNGVGIQGLPFTSSSTARTTGSVMIRNSDNTTITAAYITSSSNTVEFYGVTSGVWDQLKHNDLNNSSSEIYFNITYRTNA